MIHYNSNNNAYCRAVNAETFQTIEHNPVWISILLYTRNPYSYSHSEIVICIYSVRGDIDQISTNTSQLYHLQRTNCLHFCLHIDWNPYSTFNFLDYHIIEMWHMIFFYMICWNYPQIGTLCFVTRFF